MRREPISYSKVGDLDLLITSVDDMGRIVGRSCETSAVWTCHDCGAAVIDKGTHTAFHNKLALLRVSDLHQMLEEGSHG